MSDRMTDSDPKPAKTLAQANRIQAENEKVLDESPED